ncbi:MAG TPA: hypothetical protein VFE62_16865 [Gemmataceae bacterium]|nr:hypothetical protein [Gemmataceae bacterium]
MTALKIVWSTPAKKQFDDLHKRAIAAGRLDDFLAAHAEVVRILGDLEKATEKSDPLYSAKKPGGMVRHLVHRFLSVTFHLYPDESVVCIARYVPVPSTWPF